MKVLSLVLEATLVFSQILFLNYEVRNVRMKAGVISNICNHMCKCGSSF